MYYLAAILAPDNAVAQHFASCLVHQISLLKVQHLGQEPTVPHKSDCVVRFGLERSHKQLLGLCLRIDKSIKHHEKCAPAASKGFNPT